MNDKLEVVIFAALLCVVGMLMQGCSGELYMGSRRIDEYQATQTMHNQPLFKCLFSDCTGGNAK